MISSHIYLGLRLADLSTPALKRLAYRQSVCDLQHDSSRVFDCKARLGDDIPTPSTTSRAHLAAVKCLAIDQIGGRYVVSGGSDAAIRMWDVSEVSQASSASSSVQSRSTNYAVASLTKAEAGSHTHALTSLSVYPHSSNPSTILSTSYDTTLLLTAIEPTRLVPLYKTSLDYATYTHAISPIVEGMSATLVAVGTAHPVIRLLDLRSGLSTHSLAGHQGEIWSLAWHPRQEHVLISSGTDGRILAFDIRRANPAFASFDVEDAAGVFDSTQSSPSSLSIYSRPHLDYNHRAHDAPITGIVVSERGDKLISCAQDSRIRVWDLPTGKNDLVYFGPRIRNSRAGPFAPLLIPSTMTDGESLSRGHEAMFWANDDGMGEIMVLRVSDGTTTETLKMRQLNKEAKPVSGRSNAKSRLQAMSDMSRRGKINAMAFRSVITGASANEVELYTGHGDGSINVWNSMTDVGEELAEAPTVTSTREDETSGKKRKRDLISDLVQGLSKRNAPAI